jgi:tryptophanyl-tRNA synthetase
MSEPRKKRVLTGVKPTGVPHIGNYLGAIQPALELSKEYDSFLFIADLHALTTRQDPAHLTEQTFCVAATWLAAGLDPSRVVFYKQSDIPEIPTLAWILSCYTPLGLLNRAHSIKAARQEGATDEDINHGLFTYPVLMAADILIFDTDVVPVGKDQKQHLEIAQEAARKLNLAHGEVLRVPEPKIDEAVMTVPGLDGRKMSKSYGNSIELFASDKELWNKIKNVKTDSTVYGQPLNPENEVMFEIYKLLGRPEQVAKLEAQYRSGRTDPNDPASKPFGWGDAKKALNEIVLERFGPARAEYRRLMNDKPYLRKLLAEGAEKARTTAAGVLGRVLDAVGIVR